MEIEDKDFKQLLTLLQRLVDNKDNKTSDNDAEDDDAYIKETQPKRNSKQKTKKKKIINKFKDMPEANMHKEDIDIDKKLRKFPPTQRSRKYNPVNVKCRVCGKEESINPALIESRDRYKCNKCCTTPG